MITPRNGGSKLIAESESLREELLRLSGAMGTWAEELKGEAQQLKEEAGEGTEDDDSGEEAGQGGPADPAGH